MLRVAQLIESDGPGGAEQVVVDLAVGLQASGAHSLVLLPACGEGWLARQLAGTGVSVEYVDLSGPFSPAGARAIARSLRAHRIDVAHSHEFTMAVYGAWASRRAGVRHVITLHGSRYYAGRLKRRVALRAAIALSDQVVAVSHALANDLGRDLLVARSAIDMITNGVRSLAAPATSLRQDLRLGPEDRLLVAVGNLYPVKGHRFLVDALALLANRHPTLHVAIAGRGDLASSITAGARAGGVASRVHLLGLRSDVPAVLAAADLFALPSLSEGLPLALIEAMFAGLPIVASEVGEVATALGGGAAGVLVPPGDPAALAEAIDDLLTHPARARACAEHARRRAAAHYDVSNMVRRYRALYERPLAREPQSIASLPDESLRPTL
jgi:glycosyltransferase involved in cell wall biosynthesis